MTTKAHIIQLLSTNDRAVGRALVALTARQTADEQQAESTRHLNGRGFRPCHARMGTSMAQFFEKYNRLSEKQVAYWRVKMRGDKMRIEIYAGQLLEVAAERAARLAARTEALADPALSLRAELASLKLQYADYQDSDDFNLLERMSDRMHQIHEQLEEINRCMFKMQRDSVV